MIAVADADRSQARPTAIDVDIFRGPPSHQPSWPVLVTQSGPQANCRASQARANRQSRFNVLADWPTTFAVSSMLNPV
jgi:hypothetical protein